MLLFLLIIEAASILVSANPLFPQHQCFCEQNYIDHSIPFFFQHTHDYDPYTSASTSHIPLIAYPDTLKQDIDYLDSYLQEATNNNHVLVYPTNQAAVSNSVSYPTNHVQGRPTTFVNQAMPLIDRSFNSNQGIPVGIDGNYNLNNGIPILVDNRFNLNRGVPLQVDNSYNLKSNQQVPLAGSAFNTDNGIPFVENPITAYQGNTNEYLNPAAPVKNQCRQTVANEKITKNNDVKKLLIEQLLSNPTLKTLIDPNTKLYNQNGVEVPRHIGNNDCSSPNVINNYIIVPPEVINDPDFIKHHKSRNGKNQRRGNKYDRCDRRQSERPRRRKNRRKFDETKTSTEAEDNKPSKKSRRKDDSENLDNEEKRKSRRRKLKNKPKSTVNENSTQMQNQTNTIDINNRIISDSIINKPEAKYVENSDTYATKTCLNYNNPKSCPANPSNPFDYNELLKAYQNTMNEPHNTNSYLSNEINGMKNPMEIYQKMFNFNNNVNNENISPTHNQPIASDYKTTHLAPNTGITDQNKDKHHKDEIHLILSAGPNPREEEAVKEICRKFPGISEELVRKLIAHLKKQLLNDEGQFRNSQYPLNGNNFFIPQQQIRAPKRNTHSNRKRKQKKPKLNNNKTQSNDIVNQNQSNITLSETTIEQTPTLKSKDTDNILDITTEKPSPNLSVEDLKKENDTESKEIELTKKVDEPTSNRKYTSQEIIQPQESKNITKTNIDNIIETSTARTYTIASNEIAISGDETKNNEDLPIFYGIIDDYYPNFKEKNEALLFQDDEYATRNLDTDRYHYTTDRNLGISELSRERRKYELNYDKNNLKVTEKIEVTAKEDNNKTEAENKSIEEVYENIEYEKPDVIKEEAKRDDPNKEHEEEIQYVTPPVLEIPDFETKMIERVKLDERDYFDVNDKISTFSDFKTTQHNAKLKPSKSNLDSKKQDVETIFARSRVAVFGQEEMPVLKYNEPYEYDSRTSIVLAKSVQEDNL